jgi:RNA polymerase-binding transcription factor DksA
LSSAPTHPADVGTDNFEQEQTFAFIQSRSERLEDIDDALERTKDGTYGVCERCNCKIPKARLNYLPYVTMCVKCTEITEREAE